MKPQEKGAVFIPTFRHGGSVVKNLPAKAGDVGSIPGSGRSPGEGNGLIQVLLPGKSQGQRSLVGYSPRGRKRVDKHLHFKMWKLRHRGVFISLFSYLLTY